MAFNVPILLLVFNRPDTTSKVFDTIRRLKPSHLYVAADGPRPHVPADAENCARVREICSNIDWDCKLTTLYREANLGCRSAVSGGIDWFYDNVEEGIVIEDDVIVDDTFFPFCAEMLERYRNDERVMQISAFNMLEKYKEKEQSYFFSHFGVIWGWATWRRAWKHYDVDLKKWVEPGIDKFILETYFPEKYHAVRRDLYDKLYKKEINTWDFQWTFAKLIHRGLTVVPSRNMVVNIGFNSAATHTSTAPLWAEKPAYPIDLPLRHPKVVAVDAKFDQLYLAKNYNDEKPTLTFLVKSTIYKILSKLFKRVRN